MVSALLNISENANRTLNTIKARNGYKDKSEAVEYLVKFYIKEKDEYELRPEFLEELKKAEKEESIKIGTSEDFRKRYLGSKNVRTRNRKKTR